MITNRKKALYYRWLWSSVLITLVCAVMCFRGKEPAYYYLAVAAVYTVASFFGMRLLNRLLNS